jgi:hypothetical protein
MDYITCNHKKSRPKVSIGVCQKCKRSSTCADYASYVQPPLFPDLIKTRPGKYRKSKLFKLKAAEIPGKPEQLTFDM